MSATRSEILSTIHGNFRGNSATRIFSLVAEYFFLFLLLQEIKYMSIEESAKKIKAVDLETNQLSQCYEQNTLTTQLQLHSSKIL